MGSHRLIQLPIGHAAFLLPLFLQAGGAGQPVLPLQLLSDLDRSPSFPLA